MKVVIKILTWTGVVVLMTATVTFFPGCMAKNDPTLFLATKAVADQKTAEVTATHQHIDLPKN